MSLVGFRVLGSRGLINGIKGVCRDYIAVMWVYIRLVETLHLPFKLLGSGFSA